MIQIALFIVLANIATTFGHNNRAKQLDRISKYTLIEIDTSLFESDGIIELDAYDQHYKVQLESNEDVHPGKLHHIKGNHAEINGHQQFYTNKNESCHYHGKVLNDLTSSKNFVALSLCDNRGIRGMIVAFDDTLYIKPAKTYLDLSHDKNGHGHNLNDQHLAYLSSDEDYSGLPLDNHVRISDEEKQFHDSINSKMPWSSSSSSNSRRRMANNRRNTVEIIAVMDPAWRQACEEKYTTTTWYDNCVNDLADLYNGISAEYTNQNWGSNAEGQIGTIAVAFAKVYVMFSFSGDDSVLLPDFTYSNCKDMMNTECSIDGSGYLGKLRTWVGNMINKGTESQGGFESTNFDDVQLWSSMNFKDAGGWGYIGTVCRGALATANIAALYGDAWSIRSAAHELGHNFDMVHDQDTGGVCNKDSGLMGYGNTNHGFSTCSVKALQEYFAERSGLTCLGSSTFGWDIDNLPGVGNVRSNYGNGGGGGAPGAQATDSPTSKPTSRPTQRPTSRPTNRPTAVNATPLPTERPTSRPTAKPTVKPTARPTTDGTSGNSDDWQCVITDFPILRTAIFSSNVIRDDTLNGRWTSDGQLNGKVVYELNGYYLYKKSTYWLIATAKDSWSVVAYCTAELLSECDGAWSFYQGGWQPDPDCTHTESDCTTGGGNGGDTDTVVIDPKQCSYKSCLQMNGLEEWSGLWSFHDCDTVNKGIYKNSDASGYLCFNLQYNLWFISPGADCSASKTINAYCKWTNADITQCGADAWRKLSSGSFVQYSSALIFDCANEAFNAGETTECTDETLNEKLCIKGNSNLISAGSPLEFSLFNGQCANNKPIYSYTVETKNDTLINLGGIQTNRYTEKTLYLHYNLYKKYSDDQEFSGQWVISDGEVNSNYDAVCEQESILDCVENQWQVLDIQDETGGGIIQFIDDVVMRINNTDCDGNTSFDVEEDEDSSDNAIIIIVVCLSVVLILCVCAFFLFKRSNKGDDKMIKRHVSNNATTTNAGPAKATPETDELPDQGSPVPETEVSMERGADGAAEIVVTTTVE